MIRAFILGVILGIAAAIGVAWYPVVSHDRITSITRVAPNGGRIESFHISLPDDRLLLVSGKNNAVQTVPPGLNLPDSESIDDTRAELFRLRDAKSEVVGVASRLLNLSTGEADWLLYLPARGAMFLSVDQDVAANSEEIVRAGRIVGGSESMSDASGSFEERRVSSLAASGDAAQARIEIVTTIESNEG